MWAAKIERREGKNGDRDGLLRGNEKEWEQAAGELGQNQRASEGRKINSFLFYFQPFAPAKSKEI